MIRQHINTTGERDFQWRGGEITRLEGFSDAVFAFAVTLLVVSLEVPKSFHELMAVMRGFIPFAICFALLAELWYKHYLFFRRYGLQNRWTIFLNSLLLFFILFFVYPLKFLFFVVFNESSSLDPADGRGILIVYGGGYAAVFLIFALLYLHAWRQRHALALNGIESLKTRHTLIDHCAMVAIGLISVTLACTLPPQLIGLAGWFYTIIGVYYFVAGTVFGKRQRLLSESMRIAEEPK